MRGDGNKVTPDAGKKAEQRHTGRKVWGIVKKNE